MLKFRLDSLLLQNFGFLYHNQNVFFLNKAIFFIIKNVMNVCIDTPMLNKLAITDA